MSSYVDRGAPFSAWLYRIAHNLVANWHRDRVRHETVSLDSPDVGLATDGSQEGTAARMLTNEMVAAAVGQLDPDRRDLLVLKFHGLSNAEIAEVLGRTEGAVKSLYHRTLVDLRDELEADDRETAPPTGSNREDG